MIAALAALIWIGVACWLLLYLWPDIVFTVHELEDRWAALILVGIAVIWPISVAVLLWTCIAEYRKSKC